MPTLAALGAGDDTFALVYEEGRNHAAYQIKQIAGGVVHHVAGAPTPELLRREIERPSGGISGVIHPETQIIRDTMERFLRKTFTDPEELRETLAKFRGLTADEVRRAGLAL